MKKSKTIVITGSEGEIGKSLKKFLENQNHKIIGIDLKKGRNNIQCDITNEKQLKFKLNKVLKKNNPDILINAASIIPKIKKFQFTNYESKKWIKTLKVDLWGSFFVSKICCKYFEKKNSGLIINLSSIYGVSGPDQSIYGKIKKGLGYKNLEYSVAKAGLIGFTKALASFYTNTNIKVLCLIIGGLKSKKLSKNFVRKYLSKTIEKKMINSNQICKYIEFCISNPEIVSGTSIKISGGADSIF